MTLYKHLTLPLLRNKYQLQKIKKMSIYETGETPEIAFRRLLDVMDDLRAKCPWDKKQTMLSLRNLTIEETYELADAILDADMQEVKEEIGDLLLHLVFYSKIASETEDFTITDALNAVCEKLIQRHPHIYGDVVAEDEETVMRNWEQLKLKGGKTSVLQGVPRSLPAMVKSYRMQEKAGKIGFEWENPADCWAKIKEEMAEFEEAQQAGNRIEMEAEMGDFLFAIINYCRQIGIEPETALERTNRKFKKRFEYIEKQAVKPLSEMTLAEMDVLWNEAKKL